MELGKETWGGFLNEVTAGQLSAGATSQISTDGLFATHKFAFLGGRNWQVGYTAPATPGLVQVFVAANTVNGDGIETGDMWAFHGDPTGTQGAPINLFVNAAGVTDHGGGCVGSFGNTPVLGSAQTPTVGNSSFGFEVHGAATNAPAALMLGGNPAVSLDLGVIGGPGCDLRVLPLITFSSVTGPGSTALGEGTSSFPLPLPNNPAFVGRSPAGAGTGRRRQHRAVASPNPHKRSAIHYPVDPIWQSAYWQLPSRKPHTRHQPERSP